MKNTEGSAIDIYDLCTNVVSKCKDIDEILAYTYLLKFAIDGKIKYYYGVRYGNVRVGISPIKDIWQVYFSSSKEVKILLEDGYLPFEVIIHKTFKDIKKAIAYEVQFLTKLNVSNREDFINKVSHWPCAQINLGRKASEERKLAMSKISSEAQSDPEYRKMRAKDAKERWADPEFRAANLIKIQEAINKREENRRKNNILHHSCGRKNTMEQRLKQSQPRGKYKKRGIVKMCKCPECNKILGYSNIAKHLVKYHNYKTEEGSLTKAQLETFVKLPSPSLDAYCDTSANLS